MKKLSFLALSSFFFNVTLAAVQEVDITDMQFNPSLVEINQGDTIRWINRDSQTYELQGSFGESGSLGPDDRFEYVFRQPGNFEYSGVLHPNMTGRIRVAAAPETSTSNNDEALDFADLFGTGSGFAPDDLATVNQTFETDTTASSQPPAPEAPAPTPSSQAPAAPAEPETMNIRSITPVAQQRGVTASAEQNLPAAGGDNAWLYGLLLLFLVTGLVAFGINRR